jgi:hypothetical protein
VSFVDEQSRYVIESTGSGFTNKADFGHSFPDGDGCAGWRPDRGNQTWKCEQKRVSFFTNKAVMLLKTHDRGLRTKPNKADFGVQEDPDKT